MLTTASPQKSYVTERTLLEPTKYDHRADSVEVASTTTPKSADIPVVKGPRGLCYDVGKVADEGRRKKIIANRASAKSSRQRRLDEARGVRDELARLEVENSSLREANVALLQQITEAQSALERFHAFIENTITQPAGELGMKSASAYSLFPWTREPRKLALSSVLPAIIPPHEIFDLRK